MKKQYDVQSFCKRLSDLNFVPLIHEAEPKGDSENK